MNLSVLAMNGVGCKLQTAPRSLNDSRL